MQTDREKQVSELIKEISHLQEYSGPASGHWHVEDSRFIEGYLRFYTSEGITQEYTSELALRVHDYLAFRWKLDADNPESVTYAQYEHYKTEKGEWLPEEQTNAT